MEKCLKTKKNQTKKSYRNGFVFKKFAENADIKKSVGNRLMPNTKVIKSSTATNPSVKCNGKIPIKYNFTP